MKNCSECSKPVNRYFANGFLRWPETCGKACAAKRKNRLQNERRSRAWEAMLFAAGKKPHGGFKFFVPPADVCFSPAPKKQTTKTIGQ